MINADLFIHAFALHNIADWFLQNEWMALHKAKLNTVEGWQAAVVHSGIHFAVQALIFPVSVAGWIGLTHFVIDARWILEVYRQVTRQTTAGPFAIHVAVWQDQAAHWLVLWAAVYLSVGF